MSTKTVGTCSICSGRVSIPWVWGGITPPIPTCERCGAEASSFGPVIPMRQPGKSDHGKQSIGIDWSKVGQWPG